MGISKGIPVVAVMFKNGDQKFLIKIGDSIQTIILNSGKVIENAILRGIELDFYNAVSTNNYNYDNVSPYMYRNADCGLGKNTSNKFDVQTLAVELPNKTIIIIEMSEIKSVSLQSKEDAEWIDHTTQAMEDYINNIQPSGNITEINIGEYTITAVISSNDQFDIGLIDFITGTPGITSAEYEANGETFILTVSDPDTYEPFQQGITNTLPKENGKTTIAKLTLRKE